MIRLARTAARPVAAAASRGKSLVAEAASSERETSYGRLHLAAVGAAAAAGGYVVGSTDSRLRSLTYPVNSFRSCCEVPMTEAQKELPGKLEAIVGGGNVRRNYLQRGSRMGQGTAMVYVSPGTLQEAVDVLQACVSADTAVIPQGANTSLTGGSVCRDDSCDRPTVVINMRRLNKILPIGEEGHQVLCFSGAGIFDLKTLMESKYGRDSHSVLGSIFLNPSVGAGVAYGSGGTQIRKGPSWTERALFCRVTEKGSVELINTLGLKDDGDTLNFLNSKSKLDVSDVDPACKSFASWPDYDGNVRQLDSSVSRYNADTTGLECNRSEGKVMILATIHDTWPLPKSSTLIWASCTDYDQAQALKRAVALKSKDCMSRTCEYFNREVHQGVDRAGRILVWMIELVGMQRLEPLWNLKLFIEGIPLPFTNIICDKFLYWFNNIFPQPLPADLQNLGRDYDHHLLMELGEYSDGEVERLRQSLDKFVASAPAGSVKYHVCADGKEKKRAELWRFVVAPAFRTYCIGKGQQGLSIDFSMPKNATAYPELPEKKHPISERWVYSHFGCNVFHEDLVFGAGVDVHKAKLDFKRAIEGEGGRLPAEHGHGTEYKAPKDMQERWKRSDPLNVMNPGVGGTSYNKKYAGEDCKCCP